MCRGDHKHAKFEVPLKEGRLPECGGPAGGLAGEVPRVLELTLR